MLITRDKKESYWSGEMSLLAQRVLYPAVVLLHLGLGQTDIVAQALTEELGRLGSILHEEMAHDDVGSHLVEVACAEVEHVLVASFLHGSGASVELLGHCKDPL